MRHATVSIVLMLGLGCPIAFAVDPPTVTSFGFDASSEGWTGTTGSQSIPTSWVASGGVPGGYMRFGDRPSVAAPGYALAPSTFLGDWSGFNNATLEFDSIVLSLTGARLPDVELFSGTAMVLIQADVAPDATWTHHTISLTASEAGLSEAEWLAHLANITQVRIDVDLSPSGSDVLGLDNVTLTPEPSTLALLLLALPVVRRRR